MDQEIQIYEVLLLLENAEFQTFKKILSKREVGASAWSDLTTSREDIASQLMKYYGSKARSVVARTLHHVPALHLLEKLGEPSLESGTQEQENSTSTPDRREPPIGLGEPIVTQKKLMKLAKLMGHEWRQLGIMCLGLQQHQLERLEEDHSTTIMRIFNMLQLWRNQERERATATRLYQLLNQGDILICPEALEVLLERT